MTVPISTRFSPETLELVDQAMLNHGITFRAAIETAVQEKWGQADRS